MIGSFKSILTRAASGGEKKRAAIAWPDRRHFPVLEAAVRTGLIAPVLVGDENLLAHSCSGTVLDTPESSVVHESLPLRALDRAVGLVREGEADILLQGATNHQVFIDRLSDNGTGLLVGRLLSHVSVFEVPQQGRLVLVTDTYMQNQPSLAEKQWILENVLRLAAVLDIQRPKVAALAAIEQVNPGIPSTLDAAVLAKMADRRQFGDIVLEGPLDIDCALDRKAAARKGVQSDVTGNVDIYLAPEMDTGYSLAQLLVYIGEMRMAGALMGTSRPVVLDLPFVSPDGKLVEIALAVLMAGRGLHQT